MELNEVQKKRLEMALELASQEVKILSDPNSRLYPMVKKKIDNLFYNHEEKENESQPIPVKIRPFAKRMDRSNLKSSQVEITGKLSHKPQSSSKIVPSEMMKSNTEHRSPVMKVKMTAPPSFLSRRPIKQNKVANNHSSANQTHEFVVPVLRGTNESKTGLKSKDRDFRTELEKMREESDLRLQRAIERAAAKRQEIKNQQTKSMLNSKVKAKVNSRKNTAKNVNQNPLVKQTPLSKKPLVKGRPSEKPLTPQSASSCRSINSQLNSISAKEPISLIHSPKIGTKNTTSSRNDHNSKLVPMEKDYELTELSNIRAGNNSPLLKEISKLLENRIDPLLKALQLRLDHKDDDDLILVENSKQSIADNVEISQEPNTSPIINSRKNPIVVIDNPKHPEYYSKSENNKYRKKELEILVLPTITLDRIYKDNRQRKLWANAILNNSEQWDAANRIKNLSTTMLEDTFEHIVGEIELICDEFVNCVIAEEFSH